MSSSRVVSSGDCTTRAVSNRTVTRCLPGGIGSDLRGLRVLSPSIRVIAGGNSSRVGERSPASTRAYGLSYWPAGAPTAASAAQTAARRRNMAQSSLFVLVEPHYGRGSPGCELDQGPIAAGSGAHHDRPVETTGPGTAAARRR